MYNTKLLNVTKPPSDLSTVNRIDQDQWQLWAKITACINGTKLRSIGLYFVKINISDPERVS